MAWGRNKHIETISADELVELQQRAETLSPEKLVIVVGPSFSSALKFLLLGAAIGAAAVTVLGNKSSATSNGGDPVYEGVSAAGAKDKSTLAYRANAILGRAKSLASRARDAAQIVADAARPTIEEALNQGKAAADQAKRDLESDIAKEEG